MLEASDHAARLRIGRPIAFGPMALLAIERVTLRTHHSHAGVCLWVVLQPHALIVRDAGGTRAYDPNATAISLARLRQAAPGLDAALAAL